MPTDSQRDDHNIDHIPYRPWCDGCVEGFGREDAHHTSNGQPRERQVPVIHCDYMFLIDRGLFKNSEVTEEEKADALTVLVIYDSHSRGLFAHGVPCKGAVFRQLRR